MKSSEDKKIFVVGKSTDTAIILTVLLLIVFGLIMVYTTSYYTAQIKENDASYYLRRQILMTVIGLGFMFAISLFHYQWTCRWATWFIYLASIVFMFLVNFTSLGSEINGRKRWLRLMGISFQPTEVVKLAVIMVTALLLVILKHKVDKFKYAFFIFFVASVPIALVFANNLSSSIIIFAIVLMMMTVASDHKKKYLILLLLVVAGIATAYFFGDWFVKLGVLKNYQLDRINVWKDPEAYSLEGGWQVVQGLYAIGSGGFFGKGLGNSTQKLGFVPEAQNDMVFSILVEELGIFGALCLIALFVFLVYRILVVASNAPDRLGFFICAGVAIHVSLQVVLNIAVVTNMIPNTGVTLPFISYGGSSVIFLLSEFGLVLSVARESIGVSRKRPAIFNIFRRKKALSKS